MSAEVQVDAPRELQVEPEEQENPVLVTGFGPFHYHAVNASWIAVQEMDKLGIEHKSTREKGPGIYCMRMHQSDHKNLVIEILS